MIDRIEGVPIGHLDVREGVVQSANERALALLGADLGGAPFAEAIHATDRGVIADLLDAELARPVGITCRPAAADGGVEWVRCWLAPSESGVDVLVVDRTADRRADVLADYDSAMAHDLRNPLNVIDGRLELLDVGGEHRAAIQRSTTKIADRITALRELAAAGRPLTGPALLAVDDLIADATRRVPITVDGPATDRAVVGDADRLTAAFVELFENAADHGDADRVLVTVDGSTLRIADDGEGALDPDRVLDAGYTTDPDRAGYGLTAVDWTARVHGWSVDVTDDEGFAVDIEIGDPLLK